MQSLQRTLKNAIHCSGTGVHSGRKVAMTLHPAAVDSGIRFLRNDIGGGVEIPATFDKAVESPLCSTLTEGDIRVSTIEHLMSAFAGLGIDNVLVELDGPEVPVMDGSAAPFLFLIECAGIEEQAKSRRAIKVLKTIEVREPHRAARLRPLSSFEVSFEISFDNHLIGNQSYEGEITPVTFKKDIARARTFGFLHEVDQLRKAGLALGGSLENAIVIDGERILNEGGLRFSDEFVRHKVLDSIGDLYMAGGPLLARFEGEKAGHALTLRLLKKLFSDSSNYCWVEASVSGQAASLEEPLRAVAQSA